MGCIWNQCKAANEAVWKMGKAVNDMMDCLLKVANRLIDDLVIVGVWNVGVHDTGVGDEPAGLAARRVEAAENPMC